MIERNSLQILSTKRDKQGDKMIKRLIRMEYAFTFGIVGLTFEVNSFEKKVCVEQIEAFLIEMGLAKERIRGIELVEMIE